MFICETFIFKAFLKGFASSFSVGWPTCESKLDVRASKNNKDDWFNVSCDLKKAIEKYQEKYNVK